jgi:hypothetical protein
MIHGHYAFVMKDGPNMDLSPFRTWGGSPLIKHFSAFFIDPSEQALDLVWINRNFLALDRAVNVRRVRMFP